jgi:ankyrin repeat protein
VRNKIFAVLFITLLAGKLFAAGDSKTSSPLITAAKEGSLESLKGLLKNNIDINQTDAEGNTALMLALANEHSDLAKLIIESNPNINLKNKDGQSALFIALINELPDLALTLVKKGAGLSSINGDGDSALQVATTANANEVMKLVIKKKSSLVNKLTKNGVSPLMEAARFGSGATISILLNAGADKKVKNKNGKTALDIAIKAQNEEAIQILTK